MACAPSLVKYLLFLFNFIFVVGGIALVALGALTYTRFEQYDDLTMDLGIGGFRGPPIAMMICGTVIFFIAFLGCCGALRESHTMMTMYGTILAILLILEIGLIIVAAIYKDDVEEGLQKGFLDSMKNYGGSSDIDMEQTATWDNMQQRFKCCGTMSYKDWHKPEIGTGDKNVPASCCKDSDGPNKCPPTGLPFPPDTERIYTDGCYTKAISEIGVPRLIAVVGAIGGVELLGVIFGCCLAARYRNKHYRPR